MASLPRFCLGPGAWRAGELLALPPEAARHAQVLRLQPGDALRLFDGEPAPGAPGGLEWPACVERMGRQAVEVRLGEAPEAVDRELGRPVILAVGMPANERMDALVEKATELGVAAVQPLVCARSVLRLAGERAGRKREHWRGVARAAAEQCGRARLPEVRPVQALPAWLAGPWPAGSARGLLSLAPEAMPLARWASQAGPQAPCCLLSGPEGGLTPEEEQAARAAGFQALSLGPRVLRADTAPLAALALLGGLG